MHDRALAHPPITLICARCGRRRHTRLAAPIGGSGVRALGFPSLSVMLKARMAE
jgi:hypothetical protein